MAHALERYKKTTGDGPSATLYPEDWNGMLDTVGPLLAQLVQKGADFDAVAATAIGVLLDRINGVLSPAYDQVAARGAQVEALYAQLTGQGVSAAAILETTDRLFLTAARRAAILADLRDGVTSDGDTLAKIYGLIVALRGGVDANTAGLATATAQLAAGVPTLDSFRSLAVQVAKANGTAIGLTNGFVDDFRDASGIDLTGSSGLALDTSAGALNSAGPQATMVEPYQTLPPMTGPNLPAGHVASASSTNGTLAPWMAFDQSTDFQNTRWDNAGNVLPSWLQRQVPTAIKVTAYSIQGYWDGTYYYFPTAWTVLASNDGATWTQIDAQTGQGYGTAGSRSGLYAIPAGSQGLYTYYRLNVTAATNNASDNAGRVIVAEWNLHQNCAAFEQDTSLPSMQSASTTNAGFPGYRVTASGETSAGAWRAMDGSVATNLNTQCWDTDNGSTTNWIQMELPVPMRMGAYALNWAYNDGTNYMYATRCYLAGSRDGVTFTALDSVKNIDTTSPNNVARPVYVVPADKQDFYRFYRLYILGVRTNLSATRIILPEFALLKVLSAVEGTTSIPAMTGAAAPSPQTATASTEIDTSGSYSGWRAYDGNRASSSNWGATIWHGAQNALPATNTRRMAAAVTAVGYRMASMGITYSPTSWQILGSNDGTTFTLLDGRTVHASLWQSVPFGSFAYFAIPNTGSYLYYQIRILAAPDNYARVSELEYLQATTGPMDFRSKPVPATAGIPTKATLMAILKASAGAITVNTNLIASISRDGGATFKDFVMAPVGPLGAYTQFAAPSLDLTSLPSGSSMVTRFRTVGSTLGVALDSYVPLWG